MTPRLGIGRLRVSKELLDDLLNARNFRVHGFMDQDDRDREAGTLSFSILSPVLPVIEEGAVPPEVECVVTERRRESNIKPCPLKEQKT